MRARRLFDRLGRVIGMSARKIDERVVQGMIAAPYANVTVKTDAGLGALTVLGERKSEFPGVVQQPVSIRAYPYGPMAAQVLGYVGQISEPELKKSVFRGVRPAPSWVRKASSTSTTATCVGNRASSAWA